MDERIMLMFLLTTLSRKSLLITKSDKTTKKRPTSLEDVASCTFALLLLEALPCLFDVHKLTK